MKISRINLLLSCAAGLAASLWLGYQIRFNFAVPADTTATFLPVFAWVIIFKLICLWRFGQFDGLPGYFSVADFSRLAWILFATNFVVFAVSTQFGSNYAPPRGVVVADFSFSVLSLTILRLAFQHAARARETSQAVRRPGSSRQRARRAGIIGAGLVGTALAQEFATRRELGLQAVAFFDDDRMKWGKQVHGVPVIGAPEMLLDDKMNLELEEAIIAMPSAPARRVAEIIKTLERLRIKFSTVPSFYELTTGQAKVSQLRSVDVQELLGREQVRLATGDIRQLLRDRVVMVTGAGGSIGSELCRQIAAYSPRSLLLVDQSEVQLFQIEQELIESGFGKLLIPLTANVQDESRLEQIFRQHHPEAVFHAAAHKHVPLMESQPGEAIKNNALGTLRIAETCLRHGTEHFVLISTDKAINPTSVMGASKRLAEMCVQSLFAQNPGGPRFMAVRFGNVLGSSGSVVPIFNKQIAAGGPVKVTHPDMQRYFMTIPEAVGLVLQTAALGSGGEIFMLDMGQPVKIVDLARQLIALSGFVPDRDIRIEFTGLRPGEKLFEELRYQDEKIAGTRHPKILRLLGEPSPYQQVRASLLDLAGQASHLGTDEIKSLMKSVIPEYQPELNRSAGGPTRIGEMFAGLNGHAKPNGHRPASADGVENVFHRVVGAGASQRRSYSHAMRILAITNMYPSPVSPSHGIFVQEQIKGLRAVGLEVRVLYVDRRDEGPAAYYRMHNRISDLAAEFEPDIIHVMYGGVMAEQVMRHRSVCPVVVTFRGSDLLGENLSGWTRRIISHYGVLCSRRAARRADGVVVVARHLIGPLNGAVTAEKVRVIPSGIDLSRFEPMDPLACKEKLGWSRRSFNVLFASNNGDPVKRPWLARAAVDHLASRGCPAEFHHLAGVPAAEVPLWLNAGDALLLTSLHEGSPNIVKEAMACGLPVVSVDVGDVAERFEDVAGCHLAPAEPSALAAKLDLVWRQGTRLDRQPRLEEISILSVARKLKQFYEEITRVRQAPQASEVNTTFQIPVYFPAGHEAAFGGRVERLAAWQPGSSYRHTDGWQLRHS